MIDATTCYNGKRHRWSLVAYHNHAYPEALNRYETRWCRVCGCLTEFVTDSRGKRKRCVNDDGSYAIDIPLAAKKGQIA